MMLEPPHILISGVFDPLHAGHVAYIRKAKALGFVTCALADAPEKHPPLVPKRDRRILLHAIGCDIVTDESLPDAIRQRRPDILLKGSEWDGKLPADVVKACDDTGTAIQYCDVRRNSSSALLAEYEERRSAVLLDEMQRFMRAQGPVAPWTPVTDYSWDSRSKIESPHADILASLFGGLTVLDYGCGPGHLVALLKQRDVEATGYDPNWKEFQELRGPADVVICREVLEHVPARDILNTVSQLVNLANRYVYVTTRFTPEAHPLAIAGYDGLDPTHITRLNQDYLRSLFVLHGCQRCPDLEAALDWMQKKRVLVYEVPCNR